MEKNNLIDELNKVEELAKMSKIMRFMHDPVRYLFALTFRHIVYPITNKEFDVLRKTFFGTEMQLLLPSSTDIFLTGGKSFDAEIKLAKFIIQNLKLDQTFIDIGAHYGYYTLLANRIVGNNGKVFAFEAAPKTFEVLKYNTTEYFNIKVFNNAISDIEKEIQFYEFPNLYAENNSINLKQYENEQWVKNYPAKEIQIDALTLDNEINKYDLTVDFIKIDVEGAELEVLKGAKNALSNQSPIIALEFLTDKSKNEIHRSAANFLNDLNYKTHRIDDEGHIIPLIKYSDLNLTLESENLIFIKNKN